MAYTIKGVKCYVLVMVILVLEHTEAACRPTLSDSTQNEIDFRQMECGIGSCSNVIKVVYEKTGVSKTLARTPVFTGMNKTHYQALNTGEMYTLENRTDYTAFSTKHMLYIRPMIPEDQGLWRCVVYIDNNGFYESEELDISIYVSPGPGYMMITSSSSALVTYQTTVFTCVVDGINPEPGVLWEVNGKEQTGGISSNRKRGDGLWFLNNTFTHRITIAGANVIRCILKHKNRDLLLYTSITIDVKASAKVSYPKNDVDIKTNLNSSFTLHCAGSGYRPGISWLRGGVMINDDNEKYTITRMCNDATCQGSITARSDVLECKYESVHTYECVIATEAPYESIQTSPYMTIRKECNNNHDAMIVNLAIIIPVCAVSLILVVAFGVYAHKKRHAGYDLVKKDEDRNLTSDDDREKK